MSQLPPEMLVDADTFRVSREPVLLVSELRAALAHLPPHEALQTHLGLTPDSLEAALKAYLRGRMSYAEIRMDDVRPAMSFQTLPDSADRMLLDSLNIRYPKAEADGQALLQKVRGHAAR